MSDRTGNDFSAEDFLHTRDLLCSGNEAVVRATLSNNLNIIIAALVRAAAAMTKAEVENEALAAQIILQRAYEHATAAFWTGDEYHLKQARKATDLALSKFSRDTIFGPPILAGPWRARERAVGAKERIIAEGIPHAI